jgi:hypothetical protein
VQLDASTKSKIRHYLEKIRKIVDRLEVPLPKKESPSDALIFDVVIRH